MNTFCKGYLNNNNNILHIIHIKKLKSDISLCKPNNRTVCDMVISMRQGKRDTFQPNETTFKYYSSNEGHIVIEAIAIITTYLQ